MYEGMIDEMAYTVCKALGVMKRVPAVKAALREYWKDHIAIPWSTKDVEIRALHMGLSITDEEAREVLASVLRHHDAEQGVSWLTLDHEIEECLMERK